MDLILIIVGFVVLVLILRTFNLSRQKRNSESFLASHDDFAKVYFRAGKKSEGIYVGVQRIDDEKPVFQAEGKSTVYYVKPGTHIFKMVATKTPINPFAKSVSTIKDEVSVTVESGQSYEMAFDFDEESYSIKKL